MKKIISIFCAASLLCFCSCGKNNKNKTEDKKDTTPKKAVFIDPADAKGKTTMTLIGHSSIKIKTKNGTAIYIDPYAEGDYSEEANILLVTHDHDDHNKTSLVKIAHQGYSLNNEDFHPSSDKYNNMNICGVNIEAVPAYNSNHSKDKCVGYILEFDGIKLYHAGDTSKIDEMKKLKDMSITYALLPIDGVYNMGPEEATQCADLIGAKYSIPIHTCDDTVSYSQKNVDKFTPSSKLEVPYGKTIELVK